jgi:hypothetical protein
VKSAAVGVERRNQTVNAVVLQDGGEFGAACRHFADGAIEVNVGNEPALTVAPHHIVDFDRLAIGLDDLAVHHDAAGIGLFARSPAAAARHRCRILIGIFVGVVGLYIRSGLAEDRLAQPKTKSPVREAF